ncbi:hypothetical protein M8R20_27585 [Pseudomonas sp. R2.Fl]|nr:hypothetical protein [Pseudomonas sp. R2.Fl]
MSTREELLAHLWAEVINLQLRPEGLAQVIAHAKQRPDDPLADSGPALERLLALGADPRDICLLMRNTAYEAVFSTLYAIGDPGVDGDDVFMLHEDLLSADPSGMEGRPGSASRQE